MLSDGCVGDNLILCIVLQEEDMTVTIKALQRHNLFIRLVSEWTPDNNTEFDGYIDG